MRLSQKGKIIHTTLLLAILLLLSTQVLACLFPQPVDLREGQAMACCVEHCRMETTPEAAQQACQQSRIATSQEQLVVGSSATMMKVAMKDLTDTGLDGWYDQAALNPFPKTHLLTNDLTATSPRSVDLYLFTRSLRI